MSESNDSGPVEELKRRRWLWIVGAVVVVIAILAVIGNLDKKTTTSKPAASGGAASTASVVKSTTAASWATTPTITLPTPSPSTSTPPATLPVTPITNAPNDTEGVSPCGVGGLGSSWEPRDEGGIFVSADPSGTGDSLTVVVRKFDGDDSAQSYTMPNDATLTTHTFTFDTDPNNVREVYVIDNGSKCWAVPFDSALSASPRTQH